jgi:hypothetical protein
VLVVRGLGDEGRRYIEIMNRDYNIKPTTKHYGCMVDLLGRAGFVHIDKEHASRVQCYYMEDIC